MTHFLRLSGLIILTSFIISCGSPQGDKAKTGDAQEVSATTGDITMKVDVSASKIEWIGTKPTGQHTGTIGISEGGLMLTDGKITGGKFTIDMSTIADSDLSSAEDNAKLTGHLKSPDFFDTEKYPTAVFEITSSEAITGNPDASHQITGNLTMKDVTKSISFPANIVLEGKQLLATSTAFLIDRTQWNVQYGSKTIFNNLKDKFINDEISLKISLNATL